MSTAPRRARVLVTAKVAVAAILTAEAARAQTPSAPYDYGPHMSMMWGWGHDGMILGPLFMVLVLAAALALAALLVRWLSGPWHGALPPHEPPISHTPLDILRERYARGEIDKDEFEERRRVLGD